MKAKNKLLVVKIGTGLLTDSRGEVDRGQIANISRQIAGLRSRGFQTILVTSGAISCGMTALKLKKRPKDLSTLQACATIGQPLLMREYAEAFSAFKICTAQILLTSWDLDSRRLYANTQATMRRLLQLGHCVPICNENDALSFEEIEMLNRFGDNDRLSAHIALLADAAKLIILSSIDGLMTKTDGSGRLIRHVRAVDEKIRSYAGQTQSERSVGGMISKLETAKIMLENGTPMVIANGREADVLLKIVQGKRAGTQFAAGKGKRR